MIKMKFIIIILLSIFSIQQSHSNIFSDLETTVLECSDDYKKDLFLADEGIYTFKRTSNLPVGYLDCADKLREKYSNQITNSKPKIILHQNDNEWGSHVQRFPDGGNIHLLFTRGDKDVTFEKDGYILDKEYLFRDENDEKRFVIFSEKLSYNAENILVDIYDYEGEGKSCFSSEIFNNSENEFHLRIYNILEKNGLNQICGNEIITRFDLSNLQDDGYVLLKSLANTFNLQDPLNTCFGDGIYNYDLEINELYACTLKANTTLLNEISNDFLEFWNNYKEFGDTYNEKKYVELCLLNEGSTNQNIGVIGEDNICEKPKP